MKTASQALREEGGKPRLTTGSNDLDSLIDGIRPGQFYLFYGDDEVLTLRRKVEELERRLNELSLWKFPNDSSSTKKTWTGDRAA